MNYRELQKLNEIIATLKAQPNSDENIQFVLDLADKSVKIEPLERLISSKTKKPIKKHKELKIQEGGILKFTKKEIQQAIKLQKHICLRR